MNKWLYLLMAVILLAAFNVCEAASVSIAWDPPIASNGVTGYKIYHGPMSRGYTASGDAGNVCSGRVDNLNPKQTHYFALTAYNSHNNESEYSAELVWDNEAPVLTAPASIEIELEAGAPLVVPDYRLLVTVVDDFSTGLEVTQTPAAGAPLVAGMVIEFSSTDEAGNKGTALCQLGVTIKIVPVPVGVTGHDENGKQFQVNEGA